MGLKNIKVLLLNKKNFSQKDVTKRVKAIIFTSLFFFSFFISLAFYPSPESKARYITQETIVLVLREENKFSEEKFIAELKRYNNKFSHIILAQAICESGNFSSRLFKEQNNMFGLRIPGRRLTLNIKERNGYASFETWRDCVTEYMLYYSSFLRHIKTDEEYYKYLGSSYAEDPNYILKIRRLASKYKKQCIK